MEFTFTTRSEYLQYRQEWKEKYYAQISIVRKAKASIKNDDRNKVSTHKSALDKKVANTTVDELVSELAEARKESAHQRELKFAQ